MSFALDITHIGEALVAELLTINDSVKKNFEKIYWKIYKKRFPDENISIPNQVKAIPNADIEKGDPKHQIDILLLLDENQKKAIAIEAKLGKSHKSPSSFYNAHLEKECCFEKQKGSMIQFFTNNMKEIKLKNNNESEILSLWVLLVRSNKIRDALIKNNFKNKEKHEFWGKMLCSCCIISLEELLEESDREDFNEAVKKCISTEDYLQSWGIKPSGPSGVSGLSSQEK